MSVWKLSIKNRGSVWIEECASHPRADGGMAREAADRLFQSYFTQKFRWSDEYDEEKGVVGTLENDETGERYEVTANGSLEVQRDIGVDILGFVDSATEEYKLQRAGNHPDQIQLEDYLASKTL